MIFSKATHREAVQREKNCVNEVRAAAKLNNFKPPPSSNKDQLLPFQSNNQQIQAQIQEEIDLQALQTQEENIRQLEHDIRDVNEIFKNLGALVHEQGDMIDSIEASVERTQVFVENGTQQLRQASQYKVYSIFLYIFNYMIDISNLCNAITHKSTMKNKARLQEVFFIKLKVLITWHLNFIYF